MGFYNVILVVATLFFLMTSLLQAQMTSKCVKDGTEVEFHCPILDCTYLNWEPEVDYNYYDEEIIALKFNATLSDSHGFEEITCDCSDVDYDGPSYHALLIVTDKQEPEIPVSPTLHKTSKHGLNLVWEHPNSNFREGDSVYFNYTVVVVGEDGYHQTWSLDVESHIPPKLSLDLTGQECKHLNISISLPGNCEAKQQTAALLINPPYPMVQNLQVHMLDNTTATLTWEHPQNIFNESHFNYTVTAVVVSTGYVVEDYTVAIDSTDTPWEVIELSDKYICEEINFTVSLAGDCRVNYTNKSVPIFPQEFGSAVESIPLFREGVHLEQVIITFMPPELCEFQSAYYVLTFTDNIRMWSTNQKAITNTRHQVTEKVEDELEMEKDYTVTVTISTEYGNVSSSSNFSTHSVLGGTKLLPTNLHMTAYGQNVMNISWLNPRNLYADYFTYTVTALVNDSGEVIVTERVSFLRDEVPLHTLHLVGHACENIQVIVSLLGKESNGLNITEILPSYPSVFEEDVQVETYLNSDNTIREVEIFFKPPKLCTFQEAYYALTFSDGNRTWSTDYKPIADSSQQVEEEIESGFKMDKNYIVIVTVMSDFGNFTSKRSFSFRITEEKSAGVSSAMVGGAVGGTVVALVVVLLCGFGAGVMAVYLLRQRKQRKQRKGQHPSGGPMVTNPIYESEEKFYEELPDYPLPNVLLQRVNGIPSASPVPDLPPPRKADLQPSTDVFKDEESAVAAKLRSPRPASFGGLSSSSQMGEDCYTVMSPAGTLTMLPRNRHSAASLGPWPVEGTL